MPGAEPVVVLGYDVWRRQFLHDPAIIGRVVPEVFGGVVIGSILLTAVVFSAAGLYALMAVAVQRRTREIGIRIALGATPRRVLGSVFARAGRQLGGGIIAGNSLILLLAWRADSEVDSRRESRLTWFSCRMR
jgi:ABC-type antimicrobial peptide transport system permease subunit